MSVCADSLNVYRLNPAINKENQPLRVNSIFIFHCSLSFSHHALYFPKFTHGPRPNTIHDTLFHIPQYILSASILHNTTHIHIHNKYTYASSSPSHHSSRGKTSEPTNKLFPNPSHFLQIFSKLSSLQPKFSYSVLYTTI